MPREKLNNLKGIIWDLDNTLYRFTDDFKRHCNEAAAKAASQMGLDLSYEDCFKIAERSEQDHGYSLHAYITHHGLSYADLHFPFHAAIDENVIQPIEGLIDRMRALPYPQVILTNASRCWAERVLIKINAHDIFTPDRIIPVEDVDFEPKARGLKGFQKALSILGAQDGRDVLFIDDLDRNVIKAKECSLLTAYLHYGEQMDALPIEIDYQFHDALDLLRTLL